MPKVTQITAWVGSKPGELGRIATALGKAKIDITAFTGWTFSGESPIHFLASSPAKAKRVLDRLGIRCTLEEVLCVSIPDKPGTLGQIGLLLGAANINVEYAYGSVAKTGRKAEIVLSVSDIAGAAKALQRL
jgi:hypothetical protein